MIPYTVLMKSEHQNIFNLLRKLNPMGAVSEGSLPKRRSTDPHLYLTVSSWSLRAHTSLAENRITYVRQLIATCNSSCRGSSTLSGLHKHMHSYAHTAALYIHNENKLYSSILTYWKVGIDWLLYTTSNFVKQFLKIKTINILSVWRKKRHTGIKSIPVGIFKITFSSSSKTWVVWKEKQLSVLWVE